MTQKFCIGFTESSYEFALENDAIVIGLEWRDFLAFPVLYDDTKKMQENYAKLMFANRIKKCSRISVSENLSYNIKNNEYNFNHIELYLFDPVGIGGCFYQSKNVGICSVWDMNHRKFFKPDRIKEIKYKKLSANKVLVYSDYKYALTENELRYSLEEEMPGLTLYLVKSLNVGIPYLQQSDFCICPKNPLDPTIIHL